jgi:hypothetical protein
VIKIVVGDWFHLPRLGKEVFVKLMKNARLRYDAQKGFIVESNTDLATVVSTLKSALGENIEVVLKCIVCGTPVECELCTYDQACDRRTVSRKCICNGCQTGGDAYTVYATTLASKIQA